MKKLTFTCLECGKQFERLSKYSHSVTCGPDCARARHTRKCRENIRDSRNGYDREYTEARASRDFLAPLDALVKKQPRGERVAGWWR